jgi:phage shock protein PspC (stress-responsive transcriptional regulator)
MSEKRLIRSSNDKMVAGVSAGLADYFDVDPVLIRLAFVGLTMLNGVGLIAYLILAIVLPEGQTASPASRSGNGHRAEIVNKPLKPTEFEPLGSRDN